MLRETSIFTLPGKVPLWLSKCCFVWQYEYTCLCLHIYIWILPLKYLFYNDFLDSCWSIVVKKWNDIRSQKSLSIIHRNTTHLLDIDCCHKHQQQRYDTKICKFIHYMFVDRLFLLTKAISTMFEPATTHYQTLQTWIRHNTTCYHNFNALPHTLQYIFSQFSMVWGDLQQVTTRYRQIYKKCTLIFF